MKKLLYGSVFCIWYLMSLLPLRALYVLSDGLFYLIYYIVKYRRPLVRKHLADCFPEKSEAERIQIEKDYYSWFCDYIVETIKLFSMSKKQIKKRMRFVGVERVKASCQKGQSCAVYLGHTNKGDILQTSSEISGKLPDDYRQYIGNILQAQLPAGSITGAPKDKTIQIIHQAENYERGFYTGIMGIYNKGELNSAVMIRFLEQGEHGMVFKAGGGITSKSDCRKEYEEVIQKMYLPFT